MNKMIVANWKMNGSFLEIESLINSVKLHNNLVLCLPFVFLHYLSSMLKQVVKMHGTTFSIKIGAQNVSHFNYNNGSYTGDVSALMLHQVGCDYALIGHSERRKYYHETDEVIKLKFDALTSVGVLPILCVGETDANEKERQLISQLSQYTNHKSYYNSDEGFLIAYEPVYSIGAKEALAEEKIKESAMLIKQIMSGFKVKVLYGGAVDDSNAKKILNISNIDGLLVGRASLDLKKLNTILASCIV